MQRKNISVCITTYNRSVLTVKSFIQVLNDERVAEIIIVDDASDESHTSQLEVAVNCIGNPKVKLSRNPKNLDCYLNKARAISLAESEHAIIFDSDNILTTAYLDAIFAEDWTDNLILAPSFARPHFDYRAYSGLVVSKNNVAEYMARPSFDTMLNTSNYFVPCKEFLRVFDASVNPHTAEAIYTNYNWLSAGNMIKVVGGLEYDHLVHEGSHYQNNVHKTAGFYDSVINKLKQLS